MPLTQHEIKTLKKDDFICGYYVLNDVNEKETVYGDKYVIGKLSDITGSIKLIMWSPCTITVKDNGKIVFVGGTVEEYNKALQANLFDAQVATDTAIATLDKSRLIPVAPINIEDAYNEISEMLINAAIDSPYAQVAWDIFIDYSKELHYCPAAKSIHHAYVGGLVTHILFMLKMAEHICDQYDGICPIDRALLYSAVALHDIGKLHEFSFNEFGLVEQYSTEGRLIGHPAKGAMMVQKKARELGIDEKEITVLQHLILSHHGCSKYGAAVEPMCIEAKILTYLDGLDSNIEIFRSTLEKTGKGQFSNPVRALNKPVYRV